MVLNEEKRVSLVDALARRQRVLGGAGASTLSAPIAVVPLAAAQASPTLTPLEKSKGVVEIDSEDEDTGRASSSRGEGWLRRQPHTPPPTTVPPHSGSIPPVPPPPADFSRSGVVGRVPLGMTKRQPPLSYPLSSNAP